MSQNKKDEEDPPAYYRPETYASSTDMSEDELSVIPKGAVDPVYEAKARLLNAAVSGMRVIVQAVPQTASARHSRCLCCRGANGTSFLVLIGP